MLNYVRAELYKVLHRKYLYITLAVVLLCIVALAGGLSWSNTGEVEETFILTFGDYLSMLPALLSVGFFMCILVADMVFSEQYKSGTLKNEVSFGVPRSRIYLGKLLAEGLVALVLCAIILAFSLLVGRVLLPTGPDDLEQLRLLGYATLVALPVWFGALSVAHFLFSVIKSSTVAAFLFAGMLTMLGGTLAMLADATRFGLLSKVCGLLYRCYITAPLDTLSAAADLPHLAWSVAVGLGWLVVTTAAGLTLFQKRELN